MQKNYGYYQSPIGWIKISCNQESLVRLIFVDEVSNEELAESSSALVNRCLEELKKYFNHELKTFDLPLEMKGTPFQESVWKEMLKIPYGTLVTYQDLANRVGRPKAVRAVGSAVGKNPLSIIVPCHRVVRTNNDKIINYYWGKDRKIYLQELEKN